jgi:hypothetical protein
LALVLHKLRSSRDLKLKLINKPKILKIIMKIFSAQIAGLALALSGFNVMATDIYDTFPTYNGNFFTVTNGQQVGNEVTLNSSKITMSEFSFEYVTSSTLTGSVGVDLQLYSGAPTGSPIYNSGSFSPLPAAPTGTNVNYLAGLDFPLNFLLPTNFTFILTFSGLAAGDVVDLLLANPPTGQPGSTTSNYWYNYNGGPGLTLTTIPGVSADIGVDITGTIKTPDATATAGLMGLSLVGMFLLRKKFASTAVVEKI